MLDTTTTKLVSEHGCSPTPLPAGFFLIQHTNVFRAHLKRLAGLLDAGQLRVEIDPHKFVGVPVRTVERGKGICHCCAGLSALARL